MGDSLPLPKALGAETVVGVIGAGTMGAGIAQVAAQAGHEVLMFDVRAGAAQAAIATLHKAAVKQINKKRMTEEEASGMRARLLAVDTHTELNGCGLVIEAIAESLDAKQALLRSVEEIVSDDALIATNTSSLSVTTIALAMHKPGRFAGMHFFNPAPVMPLVEIVSGDATSVHAASTLYATAASWGKTPVYASSTPGFIVNRVARPFYAESLRVLVSGAASCATIDAVLREAGGFRMGPFELMDLIGNDVNAAVTQSVFDAFDGDPRFAPSPLQLEMVRTGLLGRKTGQGFYVYGENAMAAEPMTCPSEAPPLNVRINREDALGRVLADKLSSSGNGCDRGISFADGRIAEGANFVLHRNDGRSATQRAADTGVVNTVLVDYALDRAKSTRLAVTVADQAAPQALAAVTGLLQAAGYAVSCIGDVPGMIVMRTFAMLANVAADAVHDGVCSAADCDLAMQKGVSYPIGPLSWADDIGAKAVVEVLDHLERASGDGHYRVSALLRSMAAKGGRFHELT